jgi:hypothetical protein
MLGYGLFAPGNIVSVFIAAVLGFEVAPMLGLASKTAALAVRIAAVLLCVDAAWGLVAMPLGGLIYSLPMGDWLFHELPRLAFTGFWACLAWAALALSQVRGGAVGR